LSNRDKAVKKLNSQREKVTLLSPEIGKNEGVRAWLLNCPQERSLAELGRQKWDRL
jgi:hypothetical protein